MGLEAGLGSNARRAGDDVGSPARAGPEHPVAAARGAARWPGPLSRRHRWVAARVERHAAVLVLGEDAVEDQRMHVNVEVQRGPEALDNRYRAAAPLARERHEPIEPALAASEPCEAGRQQSTPEELVKFPLDALLAGVQLEVHLDRRARIQGAAHATGQRGPHHRGRLPERAVAADELGAIARHAATRVIHVEEGRAPGELGVVRVLGEEGASVV
jgi:hypothetical protein